MAKKFNDTNNENCDKELNYQHFFDKYLECESDSDNCKEDNCKEDIPVCTYKFNKNVKEDCIEKTDDIEIKKPKKLSVCKSGEIKLNFSHNDICTKKLTAQCADIGNLDIHCELNTKTILVDNCADIIQLKVNKVLANNEDEEIIICDDICVDTDNKLFVDNIGSKTEQINLCNDVCLSESKKLFVKNIKSKDEIINVCSDLCIDGSNLIVNKVKSKGQSIDFCNDVCVSTKLFVDKILAKPTDHPSEPRIIKFCDDICANNINSENITVVNGTFDNLEVCQSICLSKVQADCLNVCNHAEVGSLCVKKKCLENKETDGNLYVEGKTYLNNTKVCGHLKISENLLVCGNTKMYGYLSVDDLYIKKNLKLGSELELEKIKGSCGPLTVVNGLCVKNGDLYVNKIKGKPNMGENNPVCIPDVELDQVHCKEDKDCINFHCGISAETISGDVKFIDCLQINNNCVANVCLGNKCTTVIIDKFNNENCLCNLKILVDINNFKNGQIFMVCLYYTDNDLHESKIQIFNGDNCVSVLKQLKSKNIFTFYNGKFY